MFLPIYPPPPAPPFTLCLSISFCFSLSSRITFDSAKFETSFHATLPLFHVGRDAYKGNKGGNLSRNSKRPLPRSSFLPFSSIVPLYHTSPPLVELANRGISPISNFESMYLTKLFFFSSEQSSEVEVLFVRFPG